jgi:ornithine--oxo-acid transaminase
MSATETADHDVEEGSVGAAGYLSHNYHPLEVTIHSGAGAVLTDVDGREYLDFLASYSACNFGHSHPRIIAALEEQLHRVALTSRAFQNDQLAPFAEKLARLVGKNMMLPMNTGVEAVESAIKVARKWGYIVKKVPQDQAHIIVADGNFHGRTTSVISFSDDSVARDDFGPFTPGFTSVPFGDAEALATAITPNTVAVLIEPIQGEAGVVIPPPGYLAKVREITTANNVLFIADEIQSGLGRTGKTLAMQHEEVEADMYLLGKALGGGVLPVSAVVANRDVLGVLKPGQHGSTFGGNPLACAVGSAVVDLLETNEYQERAAKLGLLLDSELRALIGSGVVEVRVRGLWAGIDIDPKLGTGRLVCERLAERGVLAKDTHGSTVRFSPPLVITEEQLLFGVAQLRQVLAELA